MGNLEHMFLHDFDATIAFAVIQASIIWLKSIRISWRLNSCAITKPQLRFMLKFPKKKIQASSLLDNRLSLS